MHLEPSDRMIVKLSKAIVAHAMLRGADVATPKDLPIIKLIVPNDETEYKDVAKVVDDHFIELSKSHLNQVGAAVLAELGVFDTLGGADKDYLAESILQLKATATNKESNKNIRDHAFGLLQAAEAEAAKHNISIDQLVTDYQNKKAADIKTDVRG